MCGICGIIDYKQNTVINNELIQRMCTAMNHRGPDGGGIFIDKNDISVGLGHRRLSIIDLSPAGQQPMSNEDKKIWIVFNGEVYNFRDLREDLYRKGHIFKSNTDTEVVLHLYEEYSKECVKFLRGMFAFAIWDAKKNTLLLARDRLGKKPLLYADINERFCFASEFSALLESGQIRKEINYEAIDYYLAFGYIPAPLTIYKDVFKLPPATILTLNEKKITLEQYWQLEYSPKINISEADAAEAILQMLKEAVKIRLSSDVPLGAFLSGGIDSSAIVGLMAQVSSKKIKTFSIGFEEKRYDELKYARNIARAFGTEHYELTVKPKALEILPLLVERYGEPYADSSSIPTYYLAQQTSQYVKVALNGDGGDESFAGYERYAAMLFAERYRKLPETIKKMLKIILYALPNSSYPRNTIRRIRRFFEVADKPAEQRYLRWVSVFDPVLKNEMYTDYFKNVTERKGPISWIASYLDNNKAMHLLDALLKTDIKTYLLNDLLVKVDIASMANSLEARSPFLDYKLMEYAAKLPPGYKIKRGIKKYILKKAIGGFIPRENIHRRKMGFGVPIGEWFRNGLKEFLSEVILSRKALRRGYFKTDVLERMVKLHIKGREDYSYQLWALLMLELWHQRFID